MKKTILALFTLCVFALAGCGATEKAATLQDYEVDGATVPAITGVIGQRTVTGVATSASNGDTSKEYTYTSSSVEDDLTSYVNELVYEQGYIVVDNDIDFTDSPGTAKVAKKAPGDSSKVLTVQIDYTGSGYTITVSKATGTLNAYEEEE